MNNNPIVSVIITTHNRAGLLPKAVRSVLSQSFKDFELIIVDDASSDNTEQVIKSFTDDRILYLRHPFSKGGPAARNSGLQLSCGKYIAFLDDDDEWMSGKLLKQTAKLDNAPARVGIIYCWANLIASSGRVRPRPTPRKHGDLSYDLLWGSVFGSVSKALIRRECFDKVGGFNEELSSCQDWDMWFRIARFYDFDFVPEVLCNIYQHSEQISNTYKSIIPGRIHMVENHFNDFQEYPAILVQHYKQIGKLYALSGSFHDAKIWFAKATAIRWLEHIKIMLWVSLELPFLKMFSRYKYFR